LRAYQGEEQTALAFVDDWRRAPAATATAGSDDDDGGGGGGGASLSGGDCCIASRKRPRSGSAVAQPTPKRLSPTAAISADEPIQKDDLLLLYRHAAVCRADLKRGQGSCGGRPSEFWKTFPSDLKAKFQAHVKRAEQRIEQAGNREQAAGGPAPDVLVEAVVHKGQEIAAGETLSTVMWDMDKARYVSLCRLLSGGNLIGAPQLGLLMELIQLDLRLKHGDTVQWEDAYDSADGGGDSQAPGPVRHRTRRTPPPRRQWAVITGMVAPLARSHNNRRLEHLQLHHPGTSPCLCIAWWSWKRSHLAISRLLSSKSNSDTAKLPASDPACGCYLR
jgi:hypothetical protein